MIRGYFRRAVLILIGSLTLFRIGFAYIDPNTGGLIFQFLAVIFTFLTGILLFFSRHIRQFVARARRILRDESS